MGRAMVSTTARLSELMCHQCEQVDRSGDEVGCSVIGVCGKTDEVAREQDLLIEQVKRIGAHAHAIKQAGGTVPDEVPQNMLRLMFSTLTNVNFDNQRFVTMVKEAEELQAKTAKLAATATGADPIASIVVPPGSGPAEIAEAAKVYSVPARNAAIGDEDIASVAELTLYGLKGMMAYADHALRLGVKDEGVFDFIYRACDKLVDIETGGSTDLGEMVGMALEVGEKNMTVMDLLEGAHREHLGTPSPTKVSQQPKEGKAILVSGHDMLDLKAILEQTKGTGINVYTHGEMLPAHGYPAFREYEHFAGHYGGAWQQQQIEFSSFPGPIVMTSNCIIEPRRRYADRIYSANSVGYSGVKHIENEDFSEVIAQAQELPGFDGNELGFLKGKDLDVGFSHEAIIGLAGTIKELVEAGKLSRFFLIGGCDGSQAERSYFTSLAKAAPEDSVILTLGCAKFRLNSIGLGELGDTGLPRVLDVGQCNDAIGALKVALALKDAFGLESVNDLPLSLAISHLEQKAAAVACTLLHLGITNIRLGPTLPAYLTPNVISFLSETYGLKPIGDPKVDVNDMMAGQ